MRSGCGAVGSALDWGSRGREFKSRHSDQKKLKPVITTVSAFSFCFYERMIQMSIKSLINKFSDYCKNHIWQCILVVIAEIMAFGFHATHYSYHIDMLVEEYYNGTVLIGAGRFSAPLINYLTNWMQFAPFWHTFLMAIILFVSGLIFGLLLKEASDNKLVDNAIFAFWIVFSTSPIVAHQMTYPILSVVLPYLLIGISLWLLTPWLNGAKVSLCRLLSALMLIVVSVDMYESHASVFLTVYFAVIFIKYYYSQNNKPKFKDILTPSIKIVSMLVFAIVLDWAISKIVCRLFCGTFDFWYATNTYIAWTESSIINVIKWLLRELIGQYLIAGISNYSILIYDIAIFAGLALTFVISFKRKNPWLVVLYATTVVSSIALAVVIGSAPEYRMAQAIPVLVALFILVIVMLLPQKPLVKVTAWCIIGILVFNQTLLINRYTVLNFERHQYENDILQNISRDLQEFSIDKKPVLFVNGKDYEFSDFETTPLDLNNPIFNVYKKVMYSMFDKVIPHTTFKRLDHRYGYRVEYDLLNSESIDRFFNEDYKIMPRREFNNRNHSGAFIPEIYSAFSKLGCTLIIDDVAFSDEESVYMSICDDSENMPAYPSDGYIEETSDRIIVKIYD